ncbi:MAG: ECF transporter S component [Lachnospirales bacterium]
MTTKDLTKAGIIAALVFLGTFFLKIPNPVSGYIHLGDTFMLLSGLLIGGPLGGLASGLGALLADLLSGYAIYAIPTFFIKFLQVMFVTLLFNKLTKNKEKPRRMHIFFLLALFSGIIMITGYFAYEVFLYDFSVAFANILFNAIQVGASAVLATVLLVPMLKIKNILK